MVVETMHCRVCDSNGRLLLVPVDTLKELRSQGITEIVFRVRLANARSDNWLTVTEAARLHQNDVDGLSLEHASVKITRGCNSSAIHSTGNGRQRRIDPASLNAWRLVEREKDLDRMDEEN